VTVATGGRSLARVDRPVARAIGTRIREARARSGLTQREVAGDRYTKAYISALENGLIKPSVAALTYLAARLGTTPAALISDPQPAWRRIEADAQLAAGDWQAAADGYRSLLDAETEGRSRAELQLGLAEALARLDEAHESLVVASEAAAAFSRLGLRAQEAYARYWIASGQQVAGNLQEAGQLLGSVLAAIRGGLDVAPDFEVRLLIGIAMIEAHQAQPERALAYLSEARARVDDLDDRRRAAYYWALARTSREAGDLEAAIRAATESVALYRAAESASDVASVANELALVHLALGQVGRAREHALAARGAFERAGDERWLGHVLETEAQIELADGRPEAALAAAERALAVAAAAGNRRAMLSAHLTAARASRARGDNARAHTHFETAAQIARQAGDPLHREVLAEWGELHADEGNVARAYELAREALASSSH